jgi:hypothetical protein
VGRRWQELYATGDELGTSAPRLRDLARVPLRAGPMFQDPDWVKGLHKRHVRLGADDESLAAIEALGDGAACVITGQQPHLLTGPFYTAWKLLGAVALAQRLEVLHGRRVVPVYWCGADDSDFTEIADAWLFDHLRGPWRLRIPASEWSPGMSVGDLRSRHLAELEEAALVGLEGAGLDWFRTVASEIGDLDLGERTAAWVLQMFRGSGLVVIDARDDRLLAAGRPLLERYVERRREAARAVAERQERRAEEGWSPALDQAAVESGIFARRDGRRVKLDPGELDSGNAMRWTWSPSVLLRPVVQDWLLAPVAAVLGPGELAYHAEVAPLYELLGVQAARPVPRPHLTLVGQSWDWPEDPELVRRLLLGGDSAASVLSRMQLPAARREAFDDFARNLEAALHDLEFRLGHPVPDRSRARIEREVRRLQKSEAEEGTGALARRSQWLARGRRPQERIYSSWLLWAWFGDPVSSVLQPLAQAWLDAVERGEGVQWALRVEEIR